MTRVSLLAITVFGLGLHAASAADATQCRLTRYATLPMTTLSDGRIAVPVTVQGREMNFMVDTGGISATMTSEQASALGLTFKGTFRWLGGVAGSLMTSYVSPDNFALGRLQGSGLPVYIDTRLSGVGVDGTLSPDMMSRFDVDFDFARGNLNLFSQDHCPGGVVYWTAGDHVVVPVELAPSGHIRVPVLVDGKPLTAMIDSGSVTSVMSVHAAKALGISETDPKLKLKSSFGLGQKYREYTYPFQTLALDGITVKTPHITVFSDETVKGVREDMILGIGILRQLHVYIAYKEHKLYLTPAMAQ